MSQQSHEEQAREYLTHQFGVAGFGELTHLAEFDETPLEGEGAAGVFAFTIHRPDGAREQAFVVAGETVANYYPGWGLSPEEVYNLHLGTRFMLVMEVAQLPTTTAWPELAKTAGDALCGVVPGEPVSEVESAVAFRLEKQTHIVARAKIGSEQVYLMLGDLPLGISRRIDLPPQVVYRIHVGQVVRLEEDEA